MNAENAETLDPVVAKTMIAEIIRAQTFMEMIRKRTGTAAMGPDQKPRISVHATVKFPWGPNVTPAVPGTIANTVGETAAREVQKVGAKAIRFGSLRMEPTEDSMKITVRLDTWPGASDK